MQRGILTVTALSPARRTSVCLPIEQYGVIGDLHTVALCGVNGSIDWF